LVSARRGRARRAGRIQHPSCEENGALDAPQQRGDCAMSIRDVLFFDAMLTPKVVTLVYWLLLVTAVIAGLGSMFYMGFQYMSFGTFVRGLAITLGGAIGARIWCELVIVLFKLNENVQRIASSK
jgi:Domain of unknown function (DUF4282)